jgi:cyclopropane fatty-acyl-phospholipid synthase-like methyltransferase
MARFDKPLDTWQARYAGDEFHFGREPNVFVRNRAALVAPGSTVLCVADGEGRNSVFLAEQGARVTAFDFAPNAVAKAQRLAAERGVTVDFRVSDIQSWNWAAADYDAVVAIFIQFLAPEDRARVFAGMRAAVKPGGLMLLEGYRPEQVDYGTGGPPNRENMYTAPWLREEFAGWEIVALDAYDAHLEEGTRHVGMSALIDLVARKP